VRGLRGRLQHLPGAAPDARHVRPLWRGARGTAGRRRRDRAPAAGGLPRADRASDRVLRAEPDPGVPGRRGPAGRRGATGDHGDAGVVIHLRTRPEMEAIARAGEILARLFAALPQQVRPGVSTAELDAFAEEFIRSHSGATPAFKGLYGFPASACISVNEEVVHGIPKARRALAEGDLVSVDVGVQLEGWFADAAVTLPVGEIDAEARRLLDTTRAALAAGIAQAVPGRHLGDIGHAIQTTVEDAGFGIVRDLVGHGIGREPHEEPQVPNYG